MKTYKDIYQFPNKLNEWDEPFKDTTDGWEKPKIEYIPPKGNVLLDEDKMAFIFGN